MVAAVSLNRLVFAWPGQSKAVLSIPSLEISAGEQVFISGPSGSGKSTLLGLIGGILRPQSGEVAVNGVSLNSLGGWGRDAFRGDEIGFIFQQFNLIPYLSILENVLIPCHFSAKRRARACLTAQSPLPAARELLERLDLAPELWDRKVMRLSVGQQQRVAAARALIGRPSLLIADEPTSSLDEDRRAGFLRLLLKECREAGAGLLFVSHDRALGEEFPVRLELAQINEAAA
ncbi:MAG: ABC transporter ATP-binding protein [Deltaproteobacteria bacterium]|nr:ABC transporter ATP-binding protein [Deltaproteobacteria bacterium]